MPAPDKACRSCRRIVKSNVCDNCGSADLTSGFSGLVILLDPESSQVTQVLEMEKAGNYAIKIG